MRKAILAFCCAAAFGVALMSDVSAFERRADATPEITEHHWGRGYYRHGGGGWGRGRGGCYGGGYYGGGY